MNNRKLKPKKRELCDLEESSGPDSSDKEEDLDSNLDEENNESQEESFSDGSTSSTDSQPSTSSNPKSIKKPKTFRPTVLLSDSSDSGDENSEKCAICLRSIVNQEVGNPEVCDHLFCSVCIIEWSKNSNVCPLDRQQFSIILVRENKDGSLVKKVPVVEPQTPRIENVELEAMDDTVCEICGSGDREDIMLLCDNCDRGFHTICLSPPLENIPDENEWFCPDCDFGGSGETDAITANGIDDFLDHVSSGIRSLRPRVQMVRTRLLERIRATVNRIVENYVLQHDELLSEEAEESTYSEDSDFELTPDQPSTSGVQITRSKDKQAETKITKRKTARTRKKSNKTTKKRIRTGVKKRKTSTKRKTTGTVKTKSRKRKTRVKTTRTKKVKVENADGTITEKIIKTRTYKRRRQKRRKKKIKASSAIRRGLRVKSITTPKTVKGRLALVLGMVPPKKPGQLLPDVRIKSNNNLSKIDLNRSRAGIPKLHIFGPRDDLQYFSSESDQDDFVVGNSGGVATVTQQRTNISRFRDRKKAAALALQSAPPSAPKPKPVVEEPTSEYVDVLGSILDSQAIWHSKDTNTNVKINSDGSIEVIKNKDCKMPKPEESKSIDVREGTSEGVTTQAPMYPGSGNRPGGFRPHTRNSYGESRNNQDNTFSPRSGQSQAGVNFNRFGGPARNDREGYTNYLNNIPQGPTPFCRGGPPLRFRMPPRQQLRRIPFPPRNRPIWQPEEDEDENGNEKEDKKEISKNIEKTQTKTQEEEDIDLYSDIETNVDKTENSGGEEPSSNYPALGPPPEPSAFLLGLDENGEFGVAENKDKSEVYDPAEPCDSEDEMVIDENQERASTPEKKDPEPEVKISSNSASSTSPKTSESREKNSPQKASSDEDDEDCPIFSIYSSATREFSQKEEEERQREIAEDRRKIEEMKLQDEQRSGSANPVSEKVEIESVVSVIPKENNEKTTKENEENSSLSLQKEDKKKEKENIGNRLSFDVELKSEEKALYEEEESSRSPSIKSVRDSSRSRSSSVDDNKEKAVRISCTPESDKLGRSKSPCSTHDRSSSVERLPEKYKRSKAKTKKYDSDYDDDVDSKKLGKDRKNERDKNSVETENGNKKNNILKREGNSENEVVLQKVATGLEGLDVEEVSSDNGEGDVFADKRSLSSLSLSDMSNRSKMSRSPVQVKKKKKNRKRKIGRSKGGKNYEEGEIDDSEKDNRLNESYVSKNDNEEIGNENSPKNGEKRRGRNSASIGSDRQILGSKENKKLGKEKSKDKDLSWKKPSKKEKNYREGKKRSKERAKSKSNERRKSKSPSPKKDKKKNKDRKKKTDKKKDIERYDVRKIVKNKEIRKTDAFGRDIVSKSRSISRSRSRSLIRERSRNMLRRDSRSFSRSRSRSFRRGRSPVRRRYLRSRTRSRSKSIRRTYSRSRSRSRSRKTKKKVKSKDRLKIKSRSRGRKSRSLSRGRRRSPTRSRSRSPVPRIKGSKKATRSRKSWSHHVSRTPSFSPRRSRSITRSPIRVRRSSYSRSISTSWSRGRSPLPRTSSLEKLTVVLTTKDKKKWKKKKEGKKVRKDEKRRKKTGNSKEVFASGDNVLVSVNFRNNNNATGTNSASIINTDSRNTRLNSLSPVPGGETSRKKKRGSDYETERVTKKAKKSNPISKKVVDVALSNACPKRAKKLTRLSEKDAEVILNRKPVAVIDLDMSPYREQTPSPVNVVVVSDSGSGDEGKEHTPQRPAARGTPIIEAEKVQEAVESQSGTVSAPSSPAENGFLPTSGPKTPPEPQIKFSIIKPPQLRQIANPLGDDDDDDDEVDENEGEQRVESLDRRIEKELDSRTEVSHKGPNTPPAPRGPSTPKTPPSPQTSPDAYDPFEPTKSRSPSPSQADKENRPSPKLDTKDDQASGNVQIEAVVASNTDSTDRVSEVMLVNHDDQIENNEKCETIPVVDCSSNVAIPTQASGSLVPDITSTESPERKITVVITTPQNKTQPSSVQKAYPPVLKQLPTVTSVSAPPSSSANLTASSDIFSIPSPTKTSRSSTTTTQSMQVTGIQRLQHRLGSPVNRTPNSVKSTPEKRVTPRTDSNELFTSGNYMIRNVNKRNGEPTKQPRPLQDATNETIDITMEMDDSPYSPASSEGDDLFDPPVETSKPSQSNSKPAPPYKGVTKVSRKSPVKQLSKFDLLFGVSGPTLSPLKVGNKKANTKVGSGKEPSTPKALPTKSQKKGTTKKNLVHKMDEDQLRILDELPSSAVELQVKDKFLKKLNRQERVVDEVKTVLKPHYARKHITKEEYKDILRRSVPKICHSRSGEINPSKIQSLIEAYVRKFRHAKKKGNTAVAKPKVKKTMFS